MLLDRPSHLLDGAFRMGSVVLDVPLDVFLNQIAERRGLRVFLEGRRAQILGPLPRGNLRIEFAGFAASLLDREVFKPAECGPFGYSPDAATMEETSDAGGEYDEAQSGGAPVEDDEAIVTARDLKVLERALREV